MPTQVLLSVYRIGGKNQHMLVKKKLKKIYQRISSMLNVDFDLFLYKWGRTNILYFTHAYAWVYTWRNMKNKKQKNQYRLVR